MVRRAVGSGALSSALRVLLHGLLGDLLDRLGGFGLDRRLVGVDRLGDGIDGARGVGLDPGFIRRHLGDDLVDGGRGGSLLDRFGLGDRLDHLERSVGGRFLVGLVGLGGIVQAGDLYGCG